MRYPCGVNTLAERDSAVAAEGRFLSTDGRPCTERTHRALTAARTFEDRPRLPGYKTEPVAIGAGRDHA
jgi:hypothetical protein